MLYIGALIAIGAAAAFVIVAALSLFGGVDATRTEVARGFRPDNPGPLDRALTFLGVWGPILLTALLCLLAAGQIARVALEAMR